VISGDTIVAIATAPGEGCVAIIRISGPQATTIADHVFSCHGLQPSQRPAQTVTWGRIHDDDKQIDEGLLLIMRAPHSYTREDVVEFQCHGGCVLPREVLRVVLQAGARMAEPGEFTYRAFINGKMDLVQAESVNDLICACSSRAIRLAQEQRDGHLSQSFQEIYNLMLSIAADLEASLNFSDAELPPTVFSDILSGLELARHKIADLLKNWQAGHYIRNGISMVIAGRPNVGKSSLLNALTGRNRVIVSHYPGTTRDIIEESFVMDGICIRLFDTAGLRTAECEIEVEGIRRAYAKLQQADFILYVLDASQDLTDEDISIIQTLPVQRSLLIINKVDLGNAIFKDNLSKFCTVETSLLLSTGIDNVKKEIAELLSKNIHLDSLPHTIISDRHFHLLSRVEHTLIDGITTLCSTGEQALAVHHVRLAISILGEITGNDVSDDILSSVFSKFCIGK